MQRRERGTAHVNIFYFLILLVLLLGALGFGYMQMTQAVHLQKQLDELAASTNQIRADLLMRDHYATDLREVVGMSGEYAGREGFVYVDPEDPDSVAPQPMGNVTLPGEVKGKVLEFARQNQIAESQAMPLGSFLAQIKQKLATRDQRLADLQAQNATLKSQLSAAQTAAAEAAQAKAAEIAALTQTHNELQQRITAELAQYDNTINAVREELRSKQGELDAAIATGERRLAEVRRSKSLVEARNAALSSKIELINPPDQPDGHVLTAASGRAWIDLGRKDMLQRGTVFEVRAPGSSEVKAMGRVTELDSDRAEIELYDVADPFNPVVRGDEVSNDLYSKSLRRNICLLGRFSYPYTREMVELTLERLGNRVVDSVEPGVDLVIVGGDILNEDHDGLVPVTESEDYKLARSLGIEIATLSKIRDFLQLDIE